MSLRGRNERPSAAIIAAWCVATAVLGSAGLCYAQAGGSTPFGGAPFLIPARGEAKLEAENFDRGGEGVAYHDSDAANAGRQLRADDGVDIGLCNDAGGGYRIGWIGAGEWLKYSVRVSTAGKYNLVFRVSSRAAWGAAGGKLHIEDAKGTNLSGDVNVQGSGDTWQDVRANNVPLAAGDQAIKVVFDAGGFNFNYMTLTFVPGEAAPQVAQVQPQTPAAQPQGAAQEVVVVSEEPVNTPAVNRLGVFAEENAVGADGKGQVTYAEPGTYTLRGGSKVGGKADGVYLVSSKSQGDGQLIAKVTSVEGTGSAGVMYRESADADARFAAVLLTANNGTVFQRRSEKGGSALSAMAPGAKAPVWVKLVRSGNNFSAFYSTNAGQPGEGDWKPIGTPKAVAMPEAVLAGLASATVDGSAVLASVSAVGAIAPPAPAVEVVLDASGAAPVQETVAAVNGSGAVLAGTYADMMGKAANLSQGSIDWIHYGHAMQQMNRKAGVPQRIGTLDAGGSPPLPFGDNVVKYTWTDGTPTANATDSICGVWSDKGVFRLSVKPGDTQPHVLTVYVGGFQSTAQFTASLPGAKQYSDVPRRNTNGTHFASSYTLNFRAASANDAVTVQWKMAEGGNGNIQFHAASLR